MKKTYEKPLEYMTYLPIEDFKNAPFYRGSYNATGNFRLSEWERKKIVENRLERVVAKMIKKDPSICSIYYTVSVTDNGFTRVRFNNHFLSKYDFETISSKKFQSIDLEKFKETYLKWEKSIKESRLKEKREDEIHKENKAVLEKITENAAETKAYIYVVANSKEDSFYAKIDDINAEDLAKIYKLLKKD